MVSAPWPTSTPAIAGLFSRRGTAYKSFPKLSATIASAIPRRAVLDREIVHLDSDGKPLIYDLMHHRSPQHFSAFDLLCLNGRDLRELPLIDRKRLLRALVVVLVTVFGEDLFYLGHPVEP